MLRQMQSGLVFVFSVLLLLLVQGQAAAQQNSAKEAVEEFCRLETDGKSVTGDEKEVARLFLDARTLRQSAEIALAKEYSAHDLGIHQSVAEYAIEYRVVGRLDSSLRLTRLQAPYSDQPVVESQRISLVLSETYFALGTDGQWEQVKGTSEWRIKTTPNTRHLSTGAAIAYVRAAGYRSKDPIIRSNAQKTVRELQNLYLAQASLMRLTQPTQKLPVAVAAQFTALETDGTGLTPEGLTQLNQFLVHPWTASRNKIHVAKTYEVKDIPFSGNKADLYVEYTPLGDLDSSLRFTTTSSSGGSARQNIRLIFDNKYVLPARGNIPAKEFIGPSRWRIEAAPPEQWLTVNGALRYLERMRDANSDSQIGENASKSLATLAHYR